MQVNARENERIDNIGFGDLKLIQKPDEFCYGVDAVLLADFAAKCEPKLAADLGTGTGIIPLILSAKTKAEKIAGLEYQEGSFDRAVRSVELNGLSAGIKIIRGDVKDSAAIGKIATELGIESLDGDKNGLDLVTCNPPYVPFGSALTSANEAKAIARQECIASLDDFVAAASKLLCRRGHFCMVHRPSRLADIFCALRAHNLEPKEMTLVAPKPGAEPNIVLIHAIKGAGAELRITDTLFVRDESGEYSPEIDRIYGR